MIRFQRPQLPTVEATARYYERAQSARWYSNFGVCHAELVTRLEERLGPPLRVVPVANCTLGIALALKALVPNDGRREVLLPSFTFAATAAAVAWAGLHPVFVDVASGHWSLDPDRLAEALQQRGDRVAAVLAGTTFGAPPPVEVPRAWEQLAAAAGIPLIVDSAAGLGAVDSTGRPAGHLGDAEIFSLHATKPFAIGEGGLVCTKDPSTAEQISRLANFGLEDGIISGEPGLNAKLAEWPAATALAVLDDFDSILAARRDTARALQRALADSGLIFQELDSRPAWQFVPALCPTATARDQVVATAARRGVEIRTYFSRPLHTMPAFAAAPRTDALRVTEDLAARALSLPMANDLSAADRGLIVDAVVGALAVAPPQQPQPSVDQSSDGK